MPCWRIPSDCRRVDNNSQTIVRASSAITGHCQDEIDHGIVGRAVNDNACQIVRYVRVDPDFTNTVDDNTGFTTRSILCAPMSVKDRCVGAIELINKTSGDGLFSEQDRHVLRAMPAGP